mmetsp:Transcript_11079/g.40596  ORF Transcript_11079/g.40596 Transcript_11079/m.40596 type:complete len:94 (-) Transcript_11079:3174-3455(-)
MISASAYDLWLHIRVGSKCVSIQQNESFIGPLGSANVDSENRMRCTLVRSGLRRKKTPHGEPEWCEVPRFSLHRLVPQGAAVEDVNRRSSLQR